MNGLASLRVITPDASPQEAAAIIAAVEQFRRDTAPAFVAGEEPALSAWKRAALTEAVSRRPDLSL